MAALTATNWTITKQNEYIDGKRRKVYNKAVLASGEVPSGGVPGPTRAAHGLRRFLDYVLIVDQDDAKPYRWTYDAANNKFRVQGMISLSSGVSVATGAGLEFNLASGGTTVGATGAAVTLSGNLGEISTGTTLGSQTMYLVAVGW